MSSILQINQFESKFELCKNQLKGRNGEKISKQYRGYNWADVVPELHLQMGLPFGPVGYNYCDSGRYIYLKKVKNISDKSPQTLPRIRGRVLHDCVMDFFDISRKYIENTPVTDLDAKKHLNRKKLKMLSDLKKKLSKTPYSLKIGEVNQILNDCKSVIEFESTQLSSRIHYFISRNDSITKSSLIQHALPIILNEELKEAKSMGFADKMTPDFVFQKENAIGDMKTYHFDQKDQSYKLAITGYALAYEKQHCENVDCGFILYCLPNKNRFTPFFELEVFVISDVLRKNFIEKRNRLAQMIYQKTRPHLATKCPQSCPYIINCKPGKRRIDKNK